VDQEQEKRDTSNQKKEKEREETNSVCAIHSPQIQKSPQACKQKRE
jgi:hypothetical protein